MTKKHAKQIVSLFISMYKPFGVEIKHINQNECVLVVADAALFYIKIDENCEFILYEENRSDFTNEGVCGLDIEELTPNTILPKYNHSAFVRNIKEKIDATTLYIRYARFAGANQKYLPNHMEPHFEYINNIFPELKLQDRIDAWEGTPYTIVILEMTDANGNVSYVGDAIKGNVHSFILRIADRLAKQPYDVCRILGFGLSEFYHVVESEFIDGIQSHKNTGRVARLEQHLRYFSLETECYKDEYLIRPIVAQKVQEAKSGKLDCIERVAYNKPEYRWKTEEYVYKIIKKQYKNYGVIYQHKPYFLHSSFGGQMSYDVFISGLSIAIEYQGKQHFEPVDYFGGQEAFERVQQRDKEKRMLSEAQGISLVYINYWEDVTPELVRSKIEEARS